MELIHNGYLSRYLDDNITFAKTINIKLNESALLMNEGLVYKYGQDVVDTTNPRTWKYYMNLSGQYHPTDIRMSVTSIDTLETIDFTVENLRIHTATRDSHRYGTRYYYALVYRYPEQEGLINSILNPVDIDKAIEAENGTILSYPKDLVEDNETTLINELEIYIKKCIERWYNAQFAMSDNLYTTVFMTQLHMLVLLEMLNLRLKRCKTGEVHSFHLRSYFSSHQKLDKYLPYLTLKQKLWLYRNILYIERNAGQVKNFYKLIEKLLTDRGIPIAEYSVRHLDTFQKNLRPTPAARRKRINIDQNKLTYDLFTLNQLFDKEISIEPGNKRYFEDMRDKDTFRVETTNSSVTQTKVLESSMTDYMNAQPRTFEDIALNQWLYMSANGLYPAVINFIDPKTAEPRALDSHDAFIYMFYTQLTADGIHIEMIPEYLNMQYRRVPKPSVDELLRIVPTKEVKLREIAETILSRQPTISPTLSVSAFNDLCTKLYEESYWHWFLIANTHDAYERAYVQNMVKNLYADVRARFNTPRVTIGEFLDRNNLPPYEYTREEALALVKAIFEAATGIKEYSHKKLSNIQKAMIELLKQLSSYSIQFITEVNEDDIIVVDPPAIRPGNQLLGQDEHRYVPVDVLVYDSHGSGIHTYQVDPRVDIVSETTKTTIEAKVKLDPSVTLVKTGIVEMKYEYPSIVMHADIEYTGQNKELDEKHLLPGLTTFVNLTDIQRRALRSKHGNVL